MYTPCPKKPVRQSRTPRSRREVEPPQQPHIVSFRLSPAEFEQLNSHLAETGVNRSDFVRRAVMSMARGEMIFTEVMPMAVTGIERDVFELRKALAQQAEFIKVLAAASIGAAALSMNKPGSTLAENQDRVQMAIDLAFKAAPQIIGLCLQLNPGPSMGRGIRESRAPCWGRRAGLSKQVRDAQDGGDGHIGRDGYRSARPHGFP